MSKLSNESLALLLRFDSSLSGLACSYRMDGLYELTKSKLVSFPVNDWSRVYHITPLGQSVAVAMRAAAKGTVLG